MTEVTNSEKAAWRRLNDIAATSTGSKMDELLDELAPLLPDALTNPQPVLPTEPGPYEQEDGFVVILGKAGAWWRSGKIVVPTLPLHRLVPERPQVTRQELIDLLSSTINFSNGYRADQILALLARNSA